MNDDWLTPTEMREVLERLSAIEEDITQLTDKDEGHRILEVAEVLDLPEWQVREVAKAVREERASRVLRELEEPPTESSDRAHPRQTPWPEPISTPTFALSGPFLTECRTTEKSDDSPRKT